MAFTETFGGTTIYPSDVSYRAISLSANQELSWPLEVATSGNVVAQIMDVTPSASGFTITMPPANEASPGETALFFNAGSFNFTVADNAGNTIVTITPGLAYQVYLTTNTTVAGTWRTTQFGAGTSSATAGSLVGAGIKAINTTLNQSMAVTSLSVNYTAGAADRSAAFLWTGGAGTITLPAASTVGNDWFFHIRNGGTGAISLATTGGELINGTATVDFNPGDSAIIVCDGTGYFTIGFGQAPEFLFDYVSIDLTSQSSPYTLSGSNLNRIAYQFSGTLTANMQIIVPATIQQYWVGNFTTGGSYTLTVKTSAGTGVVVPRDARAILYCNGTDVVTADTGGISIPILVSQGGTGATNASQARTNLGATSIGNALFIAVDEATARNAIIAAKSGANSDITSLSGLTTPLSVAQGGTGVATFTANGLVYGAGTSSLSVTAAGTTGQVLVGNTGSAPSWATLSGIGVTSFSAGTTGLTPSSATSGAITLAGTLVVANGGTGATTLTGYVKGSGTSALTASATIPATDISGGAALTKTDDTNVTLTLGGTPASALLAATSLTLGWSGQLSVARGGTGASTLTANGVLYGAGTSAIAATAVGTTGQVLVGNTGAAPSWATLTGIGVTSFSGGTTGLTPNTATTGAITLAGTLGVANGGTGTTTAFTAGSVVFAGASGVYSQDNANFFWDDANNRLGLGTGSPSARLNVAGTSVMSRFQTGSAADGRIEFAYNTTDIGYLNMASATQFELYGRSGVALAFGAGGSERMRVTSAGNVGVGTTAPDTRMTVSSTSQYAINTLNPTAVANNKSGIAFYGLNSSTATQFYAGISADFTATAGGSQTGALVFETINTNSVGERMRITGPGNVGIGTTSPSFRLQVETDTDANAGAFIRNSNTGTAASGNLTVASLVGNIFIRAHSAANSVWPNSTLISSDSGFTGGLNIAQAGANPIRLWTNGSERMRLDSSGNVGIGTTNPISTLDVTGSSGITTTSGGNTARIVSTALGTFFGSTTNTAVIFQTNQAEKMRIDTSGNVGIGVAPSAWGSTYRALQIKNDNTNNSGAIHSDNNSLNIGLGNNFYRNDVGSYYINTANATDYLQFNGRHEWSTAPSGTAGAAITFTKVMALDASGNLGVGTTAPKLRLQVTGAATAEPPTLGVASGSMYVTSSNDAYGLLTGLRGNGDAWLQAQRTDATATAYNILLNPSGGNVGIGTASPLTRLHVSQSNSGDYASVVLLSNSADAAADRTGIYGSPASGTANPYRGGITFWPGSSGAVSIHTGNNATPGAGERMRIDGTNGNVGIGTTSPDNLLTLGTTSANQGLALKQSTVTVARFGIVNPGVDNTPYIGSIANNAFAFWANNAERMRIDSAGLVGIGTTSPAARLDVQVTGGRLQVQSAVSTTGVRLLSVNTANSATVPIEISGTDIRFTNPLNTVVGIFDANGNLGVGTTPSVRLDVNNGAASVEQWIRTGTGFSSTLFLKPNGSGGGLRFQAEAGETATIYNTLNSPLAFGTNNTERARIDASGNFMVGTTSSSGSASNTTRVIGGIFSTLRSSASVANNTATTIATLPSGEGNYMVSASLSGSSVPADYNEVALVRISETTSSITILANAAQLSLSMSGLNLQVTHLQGVTQTIQFSVLRIL